MRARGEAGPAAKTSAYALLLLTGSGVFVASLDQTVVVTALPGIFLDIALPISDLDKGAWIVTGYLIGFTAAMPLVGRISDIYGHGRVYTAAMLVFMGGSALVAIADGLTWIVAARVVQAVGGGALVPAAIAIVYDAFPENRRGVAIGAIAAIAEGGAVLGPLYGGLFIHFLDWRWIFWVNIPMGAVVIAVVLPAVANRRRLGLRVDYLGGLLLGASITALALGLSDDAVLPAKAGWRAGLLAAAVALFAAFVWRQAVARDPMLPLRLWSKAPLVAANMTNLFVGAALILALVNIPLMTDTVLGGEPLDGGLRLLRLTVMIPIGAVLGGYLYQRLGYRPPALLGVALMALGFGLLGRWTLDIGRAPRHARSDGRRPGVRACDRADHRRRLGQYDGRPEGDRIGAGDGDADARDDRGSLGAEFLGQSHFETLVGTFDLPLRLSGESLETFEARAAAYEDTILAATLEWFRDVFFVALVVAAAALIPALWLGRRPSPAGLTARGQTTAAWSIVTLRIRFRQGGAQGRHEHLHRRRRVHQSGRWQGRVSEDSRPLGSRTRPSRPAALPRPLTAPLACRRTP